MKKSYLIIIPIFFAVVLLARHRAVAPDVKTISSSDAMPIVLKKDGLGLVSFGATPDATIAELTKVLGAPTKDTGSISSFSGYGTCPGDTVRGVEWKNLYVLFGDTQFGKNAFYQYGYTNKAPLLPELSTPQGVTLGMTADDIKSKYPNAKFGEWLPEQQGVTLEARDANDRGDFLGGTFDQDNKLYFIIGGIQCGE